MLLTYGMKMEEIFKPKVNYEYQWRMYRLYCHKNGLAEGNYNNFKKWIEGK
nr:MAG TPA: hypothetical protein [Caudoviricetes sp.]